MTSPKTQSDSAEQIRVSTPLRCPICGGELTHTMIRVMNTVTPTTRWEMHAGECPEHGWFQAETMGRPPREIFAVNRPFGTSRRLVINGREYYQFPTRWCDYDGKRRMDKYDTELDPMDPELWQARLVSEA